MNRNQQEVIAYLQEEIRVLREQLDKNHFTLPNFNVSSGHQNGHQTS